MASQKELKRAARRELDEEQRIRDLEVSPYFITGVMLATGTVVLAFILLIVYLLMPSQSNSSPSSP